METQGSNSWANTDAHAQALALAHAECQEYLIAIDYRDPQPSQVLDYLQALQAAMYSNGLTPELTPEQFYSQAAFEEWAELLRAEVDSGCKTPPSFNAVLPGTIFVRALTPFLHTQSNRVIATFADRVEWARELGALWLAQCDESDKRGRANREAQRRHQLRKKDDGSQESLHARATKEAYDAYIKACKDRKELEAKWDEYVKQVYEQAKAQRAHALALLRTDIQDKKAAWETLKLRG